MTSGPADLDAGDLARIALEVAREAAALVRGRRAGGVTVADTKTSVVDVVTEADRASEELIRRRLLETRLPVRLDLFAIRRGSGGTGRFHGGDGVVRRMTFLEPMRANILANRRRIAPRGLAGGGDALPGRNWVERVDGTIETLSATQSAQMDVGDRFVIETPGGGGFGKEPT